jgi:hypothetical protein
VTIADLMIDQPALLEINRKIVTMGRGNYHRVKKMASLCSSSVCFFLFFRSYKKLGLPHKKNNWQEDYVPDPLLGVQRHPNARSHLSVRHLGVRQKNCHHHLHEAQNLVQDHQYPGHASR